MTNTQYSELFTIELLHSFFSNGNCPDFTIQPSPQTAALLKGYKIITRQVANKLYALTESDGNKQVSLVLPENMQFTFFLQLRNPQFYIYTSLPELLTNNSIYYFTNRVANSNNGKSFLSSSTPYDSSITYKPNDIATGAGGITYRALRTVKNVTPASGGDWQEANDYRYATGADIQAILPAKSTYAFASPQSSVTIKVRGFNSAEPDAYSSPVFNKTLTFDKPVSSVSFSFLPPGKYRIKVNGDAEQIVYINDELNATQTFAVIDLYSEPTLPDAYRMMDDNMLRSPLYSLAFLNRATIWRYSIKSANGTIHDNNTNNNGYKFSAPESGVISSVRPIPLSENALSLKLSVGAQDYSPIACATPQRLTQYKKDTETYDCSEIFLNY